MPDGPRRLPDATALRDAIRSGETSAEAVVAEHLERIAQWHPRLNAAVETLADEAMAQARSPRPGPLCGVPISVKETFALEGRSITVGSRRMVPIVPQRDAGAVARLRRAGAVVVARGNVPELAMAGETDNPRFGRTNNPLDGSRTCGGSSGGDGALVGSGCVAAGLGTDILGSIRIPASFCGVVGFKPASDAIDKRDSWPDLGSRFVASWLAIGPLARSVRDVRLIYDVLARTPTPAPAPIGRVRLVMPEGFPLAVRDPAIDRAVALAKDGLLKAGLEPDTIASWPVRRWYRRMTRYLAYELLPLLKETLADNAGRPLSVSRETVRQLRGNGQIYSGLYSLLLLGPILRYRRRKSAAAARATLEGARRLVRSHLADDGIMLLPTLGTLAPGHGAMNRMTMRPGVNRLMTPLTLCNYLDLPAVTLPAWPARDPRTGLLPGVMLIAAPGAEGVLLDTARCLETMLATSAQDP